MCAARDISALEAKLVSVEAHVVDDVAAAEKRLVDLETDLTGDLAGLREVYKRNIQNLGGICSPISNDAPSVEDYLRWLAYCGGGLPSWGVCQHQQEFCLGRDRGCTRDG
jgi:hypothetical protein